ncbi:MAG: serine/threonine protein kinase [Armatimonadetes bacterium]|nr:serine/threonine protein kinase [Armatimonadota bacterium]
MQKRRRVGEEYQLAPGEQLTGQRTYQVIRCLGGGAFALAYQVATESGQVYFAKEMREPERPGDAEEALRIYQRECDVLRRLGNYELIPQMHDAFEDSGCRYIIQDYIAGVDLDTLLQSGQIPDQRTVTRWCVCLCHILAFLHSRSVVHHDLKPSNIRLNEDGDPVLFDFGAAQWYRRRDEKVDTLYGTEGYLAPEYAEQSAEDLAAGMRMDVFAMGRILVELMAGKRLSQEDIDRRTQQLYGSILHSQRLDDHFVRAVFRSVDYNPERRYPNGMEMEQDVMASAPPMGRVRPRELVLYDEGQRAPEASLTVYNVGGGTLHGSVHVDASWLDILLASTERAREQTIQRNRATVRLAAEATKVPAGQPAQGKIIFQFSHQEPVIVPVRLERSAEAPRVQVSPAELRLVAKPGAWGRDSLTFRNQGAGEGRVELVLPADLPVSVAPAAFTLAHGQQQIVTVSVHAGDLRDADTELALAWRVNENERDPIPLRVQVRSPGLLAAVKLPFRR